MPKQKIINFINFLILIKVFSGFKAVTDHPGIGRVTPKGKPPSAVAAGRVRRAGL